MRCAITVLDALRSVSAYPVPLPLLEAVMQERLLEGSVPACRDVQSSSAFLLAKADVYSWLATAPDISQGGQSYSFTDEQRQLFRTRASAIYETYGSEADEQSVGAVYGYKGSRI